MRNTPVLGIDVGLNGALALMSRDGLLIRDMPTRVLRKKRVRGPKGTMIDRAENEIDVIELATTLRELISSVSPDLRAYMEMTWGRSIRNADGTERKSSSYGAHKAGGGAMAPYAQLAFAGVPCDRILPEKWKRDLRVPASKTHARAMASKLMPRCAHLWERARDDGRAEAALIALWGSRQLGIDRVGILPAGNHELPLAGSAA